MSIDTDVDGRPYERKLPGYAFAMSAIVSADVVRDMIIATIECQTGRKVLTLDFKSKDVSSEDMRMPVYGFDGVLVTFAVDDK